MKFSQDQSPKSLKISTAWIFGEVIGANLIGSTDACTINRQSVYSVQSVSLSYFDSFSKRRLENLASRKYKTTITPSYHQIIFYLACPRGRVHGLTVRLDLLLRFFIDHDSSVYFCYF